MASEPDALAGPSYADWLRAGEAEMRQAVDAYGTAPSPDAARRVTAAIQDALVRHYARLGPRLRRDAEFASMTRLYGTDLREPALRAATTALELGRQADDAAGVAFISGWMRDNLLSGRAERSALETALAVPAPSAAASPAAGAFRWARAGSAASEPGDVAKPPSSLEGWVRVDDPRAFGDRWREALGWAPQGTPGWDLLDGLYALYIKPSGVSGISDALGGPVYLASGVWATEAGRAALRALADGDVACARLVESSRTTGTSTTCTQEQSMASAQDGQSSTQTVRESEACSPTEPTAVPDTCRDSAVMEVYARPVCDHYDGRGHVFLAECDCVKQMQLPSVMRLRTLCDDEVTQARASTKAAADPLTLEGCARMTHAADGSAVDNLAAWPVRNVHALDAPVFANALMRYGVRSQRRLSGMQGTYPACVYPPCASMLSRDAYTDARITRMERDRCPPVRCEASINVDWVGGNVNIEGNMLRVRCFGGECLRPDGTYKCANEGRCLQDGKCACEGTGFRGERCEEPDPDYTGPAKNMPPPPGPTANIAGPLKQDALDAMRASSLQPGDFLAEPRLIFMGVGIAVGAVFLAWLLRTLLGRG